MEIRCKGCHKTPDQIREYIDQAKIDGFDSPEEFVKQEEGTYNGRTGLFWCTPCYVKVGIPLGKA